jgi:hypothetical protein
MASSSDCGKVEATSLPRRATSDLRNQSRHCCLVVSALHKLRRLRHSWMWSAMWVAEDCLKLDSSSRPLSCRMGSWKKVKKALANDSKVECDPDFSSTYHLADGPVSVRWKRRNLTESSIMLLEEHHR